MKIVTTAFPFVPVELGIHHFASTYLPADIFVRALRMMGKDVFFVNATDYHSIYAAKNGKQDVSLCEHMHRLYLDNYKTMNISFDHIISTDDVKHIETVKNALKLLRADNLIYDKDSLDIYCRVCNTFIPPSFVKKTNGCERCCICGEDSLAYGYSKHAWLKVSQGKETARKCISNLTQQDAAKAANSFLHNLNDWDFTRQNKFGIPYNEELTLYLWFESLIGYYSLVPECFSSDFNFVHFIGKNILYYHAVIWPILLKSITENADVPVDLSVRGFMNPTSNIDVNINNLCHKYGTDIVRFYCAYKVKDCMQDFKLQEKEIEDFKKKLTSGPVNFANRCIGIFAKLNIDYANPCDEDYQRKIRAEFINPIIEHYSYHRINAAIKKIFELINYAQKELTKMINENEILCDRLCFLSMLIATLLSPVVPDLSKKLSITMAKEDFSLESLGSHCMYKIKKQKIFL